MMTQLTVGSEGGWKRTWVRRHTAYLANNCHDDNEVEQHNLPGLADAPGTALWIISRVTT